MTTATGVATLRPVDFPAEVEAVVELLSAICTRDKPGWFPTVPGLTNDWARPRRSSRIATSRG